mgnify:CR=1 FL=1
MSQTKTTLIGDATTGTLTIGSGETLAFAGGGSINELMKDQWRVTSNLVCSAGANVFTANWERVDDTAFGSVNGTMTESSGIFTFPHTGIYLVEFWATGYTTGSQGACRYWGPNILVTANNSSYESDAYSYGNMYAATYYAGGSCKCLVDVTDTAQVKVKFQIYSQAAATAIGNTDETGNGATFTRVGDT